MIHEPGSRIARDAHLICISRKAISRLLIRLSFTIRRQLLSDISQSPKKSKNAWSQELFASSNSNSPKSPAFGSKPTSAQEKPIYEYNSLDESIEAVVVASRDSIDTPVTFDLDDDNCRDVKRPRLDEPIPDPQ